MPAIERDHFLLDLNARFFLDHIRIAKKVPARRVKTHAITMPAMAPEFNDDVEEVLLFCDKGAAAEDVEGDKVDEDGDKDEASEFEEVEVEVSDDIRDGKEMVTVVVVFNEMLLRLLDWEIVECEGVDVGTSDRISMTVIVVGEGSLVPFPLFISSMGQTTMSFTISAMN